MNKKILTGADVELAITLEKEKIELDENIIITDIAKEMADKAGILLVIKPERPPEKDSDISETKSDIKSSGEQEELLTQDTITTEDMVTKDMVVKYGTEEEILNKIKEQDEKINDIYQKLSISNYGLKEKDLTEANEILDLKIKNGFCVMPGYGVYNFDIGIKEGVIWSLGRDINIQSKETVDATGKCILPGIIDPHIHLGIYNDFELEVQTETKAAIMGGVTTAGCFFGGEDSHLQSFSKLKPLIDEQSLIDIIPHFAIMNYRQLEEIPEYISRFGVKTFKVYMCGIPGIVPDADDGFILDVFEVIKEVKEDCTVFIHAENPILIRRASNKFSGTGGDSLKAWALTRPNMAEEEAVRRASFYAEKTGVKVYFVHISTKEAANALREIKTQRGLNNIYAETTSPYLTLSTESKVGIKGKMIPPIRDRVSVEALWKALSDGIIDTVGTDNTTITLKEKKVNEDIWGAVPGYPAVATHLPSMLHSGINSGKISLEKLVEVMCQNPAKILGIYPKKGTIMPNSDADLVIVDLDKKIRATPEILGSRSDFSLFDGKELIGWPVMTIKSGKIIAENMKLRI